MQPENRQSVCAVFVCLCMMSQVPTRIHAEDLRWWPSQSAPGGLVRTVDEPRFTSPDKSYDMLVQSVAGLAAKSVNTGRGDELVWVATTNIELEHWYSLLIKTHPSWQVRGTFEPWDLVDRYVQKDIIKGYLLYTADETPRPNFEYSRHVNRSVNVATSLAGLLDGVLVEERLQEQAERHGLKLLLDVRHLSPTDCFEKYRDQFNRHLLCTQDPKKPNSRDLAIAHQALTIYGDGPLTEKALKWMEPLSPILGWNGGDEFKTTRLSSIHGHFQTATDWCMNLPVLMAGSDTAPVAKVSHVDPNSYDWDDHRSGISFVLTDGDNVQWYESSFFLANTNFWNSPDRGQIPFGWSCCFSHLTQLGPVIIDHAIATSTRDDQFLEWGGGYYYPDLFGRSRHDRWDLLARHAAKTWGLMQRNDTRIIGFNVSRPDSVDARKSYEVFAGATEGLLAIFVFQYSPYEGGAGKTYWVKDRAGTEIPVITARYSLWEHSNHRPRSGTPAKIAREITESVHAAATKPRYDWIDVHAWSYFQRGEGNADDAENMPQHDAQAHGGVRGYTPAVRCAERLPDHIRVLGPEDLAWRVRMQHDPEATKRVIETPLR